jgi:hypothetical protein
LYCSRRWLGRFGRGRGLNRLGHGRGRIGRSCLGGPHDLGRDIVRVRRGSPWLRRWHQRTRRYDSCDEAAQRIGAGDLRLARRLQIGCWNGAGHLSPRRRGRRQLRRRDPNRRITVVGIIRRFRDTSRHVCGAAVETPWHDAAEISQHLWRRWRRAGRSRFRIPGTHRGLPGWHRRAGDRRLGWRRLWYRSRYA